jgi:hypothetical protein
MGTWQAVVGASMFLTLHGFANVGAEAADRVPGRPSGRPSGLRTDRLSRKQLEKWHKIEELVMAEDRDGQPLHPTLRQLWDAVDTSQHAIVIEMPDSKGYFAGRFEVTAVDPAGESHEGVILLNLRAIDRTSTGPAAARADGFIPFEGLRKNERYAEVLGHELAHAVWHLASTERARLAERLQGQLEEQARVLLAGGPGTGSGPQLQEQETDLERLARELEEPAETAEQAIWEELQASRPLR